jgi:hypothetical protein
MAADVLERHPEQPTALDRVDDEGPEERPAGPRGILPVGAQREEGHHHGEHHHQAEIQRPA